MYNFHHIAIKEHTEECMCHEKNRNSPFFGFQSIDSYLIYVGGDFCLITNCSCIRGFNSNPEFMERILTELTNRMEKVMYYDIVRSYSWDIVKTIKQDRIHSSFVHEVNFIYYNAAGKKYAIVSKLKYKEYFNLDNNKLHISYKKSKKYLIDNGYKELINDLDELYSKNENKISDNVTVIEITKELDKLLKNKIKEKRKILKST